MHARLQISDCQVSSVEIERVCNSAHVAVLETAAIGVPPSGGGPEQLLIVAVLKGEEAAPVPAEDLKKVFNATIQSKLNPLFKVYITLSQTCTYCPFCVGHSNSSESTLVLILIWASLVFNPYQISRQ